MASTLPTRPVLESNESIVPKYNPVISITNEDSYRTCLTSPVVTFKRTNESDASGLQLNDDTADVTLIVDNQEINVHKNVLASQSDYFDKMFSNNFKERNQEKVAINIFDLSYETLKAFVEFFYTSTLNIIETNVQDLLIGSSILLLEDVQEACVNYVKTMIDTENCLELNEMSNILRLKDLHSHCMKFITKNFYLVIQNKGFNNISPGDLLSLVKDDNLFAKEDLVYDAVGAWVHHDQIGRWLDNFDLLWYCRLPLILRTYQGVTGLQDFPGAKIDNLIGFRTEYRKPFKKGILLISHYPSISTAEWLDAATDEWLYCVREDCQCTSFKVVLDPPEYLSTNVLLNTGCVFSVGGELNGRGMNSVYLFNPQISHWVYMPPMKYHRMKPCVVQSGPKVFVIGGSDKLSLRNTIEYYDLIENKWYSIKSNVKGITSARDGVFATCVNNLIYVFCKNVAGYFHPDSNDWKSIAPMPEQNYGSTICTLNKNIYVIGGYKNEVYSNSVWAYCTETEKWVSVAPLNSLRSNSGVAVMNGFIYVFGGKTGPSTYSSTFEVYDPNRNTWVTSNAHLNMARCYSDAMVIDKDTDLYKNVFEDVINLIH